MATNLVFRSGRGTARRREFPARGYWRIRGEPLILYTECTPGLGSPPFSAEGDAIPSVTPESTLRRGSEAGAGDLASNVRKIRRG